MVIERSGEVNIPLDLKLEILNKLPVKSVVRFLCISKQWKTIIRDYLVKDSIVLRSLTQPSRDPHFILQRVLWSGTSRKTMSATYSFAYYHHHRTTHESGEQLVSLDETSRDSNCIPNFQYVRGLIGYEASPSRYHQFTIHNPTTKQTVSLTNTLHNGTQLNGIFYFFFGYDPLSNQYKVVYFSLKFLSGETSCQVYTLGDLENKWRNIPYGIENYIPYGEKICINGVIYYKGRAVKGLSFVLVSIDFGFERFNHVETPTKLSIRLGDATFIDYQGKLGCICKDNLDLNLWVLENAERQEWSKVIYIDVLRDLPSFILSFAGITYSGDEIVFGGQSHRSKLPPTVYYYDWKIKKIRKVEIKTTMPSRDRISISNVVTDHVDNIMSLS